MEQHDVKSLIFKVGHEEYGVQISQVISIEQMQAITPFPNRPPHVLGVTTIRNVVTPVVDLRSALMGKTLSTDDARLVVVQVSNKAIGLVVDAATDVLDIAPDTIQHPTLMESRNVSYLKGVSMQDERLIILLDIEKLLEDTSNLDELKEIKDSSQLQMA
ncbi:chemotaxis protein CheW [Neobacillus sp. M.A.Huq-85]|nr:chemotaxis protein CheW [Neobacillus cucumis]